MRYDYDLVVIGGGAAGLVAATGAASLGAKTCMIEKNKLGGDCTWYGCVPSKALLKSSQVVSLLRRINEFGITPKQGMEFDTTNVMSHVREIVQKVSTHHPAQLFEERGIKVIFAAPRFISNRILELNGSKISSKRFIICTGSHPSVPAIEGLKDISYLTNENIFDLQTLPKSIAVLGGGPIGAELSQALLRLGVRVSIVEMMDRLLFREDEEIAKVLADRLLKEGASIYIGKRAVKFSKDNGLIAITLEDKNKVQTVLKVENVLVAVGRAPNVSGLDLEKAGVRYDNKGIEADSSLRTSARNIYACGDVVGPYQFSQMAEYQAIIAVGNALFPFKRKVNYNAVPWCTFSDPEVAHLGLLEEEARGKYNNLRVYKSMYNANDRAVTDLEEDGFAKVICDAKGNILGAHIVGANAGEIIHEYVLAKSSGLKISKLSSAIHIYPTLAQVIKRTGDEYYKEILSRGWFKKVSAFFINMLR